MHYFCGRFFKCPLLRLGWGHGVLNLESSTGYAQSWNGEHKVFSHDVPHRFLHNGQEKTIGAGLDSSKEK
jgi:hypothetical protein